MKAYKLKFTSGIHIGIGRQGYDRGEEFIRSDTLAGAMASAWLKLYGENPSFIFEEPPFLVSSAFPYYRSMLFFPAPPNKARFFSLADEDRKKVKKIRWIEHELLKFVQEGKSLTEDIVHIEGKFAILAENKSKFKNPISSFKVERVAIDRRGKENELFTFQELRFLQGGGLFFLVDFLKPGFEEKFRTVLSFLADEGIGADRTVGKGFFRVEDEFDLDLGWGSGEAWYLLSLFIPSRDELQKIDLDKSSFSITKRGGWLTCGNLNLRKRSVWALEEGSIIFSEEKPVGKNPIVLKKGEQIDFNVYRWGKAFALPWRAR